MGSKRRCFVHLPNEKKLELTLQAKSTGRELVEHVLNHFKLKEKDYFGIYFKSNSGHHAWLQDDKKIQDHDVKKTKLEFYFAFKYFIESVVYLKHCLTIELLYLHINSLIYKGFLEIDADTAFQLAAFVLQIYYGDYVDDQSALEGLQNLAVISEQILQHHPIDHCESCVLKFYKELNGWSKGKSILKYITLVEASPSYGVHYYKIKEKSGKFLWIGLSFRGIFLFELENRRIPVKVYLWRQIENLYYREKKFSIEVSDRLQRRLSADARTVFAVEPRSKPKGPVKVYSWYGNPALIKSIWQMSTSQHKFFLENQKKTKFKDFSSFSNLANDLTNNNNTLIKKKKVQAEMKLIRGVDGKATEEKEVENLEMQKVKQEMHEALKSRGVELEDKLYDKVNELKKLCLLEADIIGKYPPEYIRYMDYNEKLPKIKKRIGAEFKVKLRKQEGPLDHDFPNSVTATSFGISSSGFDPADELFQLEQEFDLLTQIANAAKKLATDPSVKRRTKKRRWKSFKKTVDKLQAVEVRLNNARKKVGQQPSIRASMLITEEDELMFEDGKMIYGAGTESERSSISEGLLLGDESSLSSGDMLSNPSLQQDSTSEEIDGKRISSSDMDISKTRASRSLTPPPSFVRSSYESKILAKTLDENSLVPSPRSSSGVSSIDSSYLATSKKSSPRSWFRPKWSTPRAKQNNTWKESSLDSIDTASTASRRSQDSLNFTEIDMRTRTEQINSRFIIPFESPAISEDLKENTVYSKDTEKSLIDELINTNKNQNNCKKSKPKTPKLTIDDVDGLQQNFNKIRITVSTDDVPSTSRKNDSDPNLNSTSDHPGPTRFRKRSSSFTESSSANRNEAYSANDGTLKALKQPQYLSSSSEVYNVQQAFMTSSSQPDVTGHPGHITKSRSSQDLQPTVINNTATLRSHSGGNITSPGTLKYTAPDHHGVQAMPTQVDHVQLGLRKDQPPPAYYNTLKNGPQNNTKQNLQYSTDITTQAVAAVNTGSNQSQPHYPTITQSLSTEQRDLLNNEVYQDIGMTWAPSLNEYSSRASVCESTSVYSRKEDILCLLKDHLASRPRTSQERNYHNRLRKMREQYRAQRGQDAFADQTVSAEQMIDNAKRAGSHADAKTKMQSLSCDKTWANYRKQPAYSGSSDQLNKPADMVPSHVSSTEPRRSPIPTHKTPSNGGVKPKVSPKPSSHLKNHQQISGVTITTQDQPISNTVQHPGHFNTVLHPGQQTNTINARGWHGNHELDVKQQILLRHYMHHNHARTADSIDHVRTHHVHVSTNQKHELQRQQKMENGDQVVSPIFAAPPDGQQQRLPVQRWMSQPAEKRHYEMAVSAQRSYQDASSNPLNDPRFVNETRTLPRKLNNQPSFRGSDKSIPNSVAKQIFLQNPYNCGFSTPRSAPSTPLMNHKAPPFGKERFSSKDAPKQHPSQGRLIKGGQHPSFFEGTSPYPSSLLLNPSNLSRTPSSDRIVSPLDQHPSEDRKLLQQHPGHRGSPSFHHTQSYPTLTSFKDSNLRAQTEQFLHGSQTNLVQRSHFQTPIFIDSIPFQNSAKHSPSVQNSRSSSLATAPSGGTLPRAAKSKRPNPSRAPVSGGDSVSFVDPFSWNAADPHNDRRNSVSSQGPRAKRRLYSTSCIPHSPAPTKDIAITATLNRIRHCRSRSEIGKVPIHPVAIPLDPRFIRTSNQGSQPGGVSHQPIEEATSHYASNSLRRIKKQSASADDLLYSGSRDGQPGTLV